MSAPDEAEPEKVAGCSVLLGCDVHGDVCQVFVASHWALFCYLFFFFTAAGGEADELRPRSRCPGAEEAAGLYLDTEMGSVPRCRKGRNREGGGVGEGLCVCV